MARIPGIRSLFRLPASERAVAGDVEDEIAFHLEERTRELTARGMDPAAARREAQREFGDVGEAKAELEAIGRRRARRTQRSGWWSDLRQDLHFGVRAAVRTPLFSLLAIITLALGIGANAAVFGVVKSVLLDSLPYRDADRLVRVYGHFLNGSDDRGALSAGSVTDIAERQRSFTRVAYFAGFPGDAILGGDDGPTVAKLAWVDPDLFRTLGVPTVLGRAFNADELADTARVVVLSHSVWQQRFAGDPGVLGQDLRINGIPRTVIGVLPSDFVGPAGEADFYFALPLAPTLRDPVQARGRHWLGLVGRLKPGVTHEAAQRELGGIAEDLAREYPDENRSIRFAMSPLREAMVGDTRTPLLVLMASAGLVLLITCANVAGALLSRTISRRKEFAVRAALGAGRGRLVRQLLTESVVLALAGGIAGVLLAALGLGLLRKLALPALPSYAELALDPGAVLVTALVALATGLVFGVAPALAAGRANVQGTLREESRGASESRRSRHLRGALVAGQIALCVSLLAGAGLLARSLWSMTATPLGFDPEGVLTVAVQLPSGTYGTAESRIAFQQQFTERLRSLPGVRGVAITSALPTTVVEWNGIVVEGAPRQPDEAVPFVLFANVSDDYFGTLRIPLRQGRTFDAQDHADAPPSLVISESMARTYWPAGDALGARLRMGPDPESPLITVIGIVGDVRNDPARADAEPIAYGSTRQSPWNASTFLLRAEGDPLALVGAVRHELAALDPGVPLNQAMTLRAVVGEGLSGRRLPVLLMTAFGALALVLASVGIYAMFASMAAAREREFGVRMALGSRPRAIATLVLRQGAAWMAAGLAGGAVGVVLVVRLLRDLLYGVSPYDPLALGLSGLVLLTCAAAALLAPVRRATRVDPAVALRAQ